MYECVCMYIYIYIYIYMYTYMYIHMYILGQAVALQVVHGGVDRLHVQDAGPTAILCSKLSKIAFLDVSAMAPTYSINI